MRHRPIRDNIKGNKVIDIEITRDHKVISLIPLNDHAKRLKIKESLRRRSKTHITVLKSDIMQGEN